MGFFIAILYSACFCCSGWNGFSRVQFTELLRRGFKVAEWMKSPRASDLTKSWTSQMNFPSCLTSVSATFQYTSVALAFFSTIFAFTSYIAHKLKLMVLRDLHGLHRRRQCCWWCSYRHCCLLLSIVIWYSRDSFQCPPAPCLDSIRSHATMLRIFAFQFQPIDARLHAAAVWA